MTTHPLRERLDELEKRKEEALHAGSERSVERQHAKGKLLARERIEYLLDPGSFHELDMLARHRAHGMGLEDERPFTAGVITGWGTIDGRRVFLFSQEFTGFRRALGGAMTRATKSGVATFVADDEKSCLDQVRYLLSFLPSNNLEEAPSFASTDDPERLCPELVDLMPDSANKPYDMVKVIEAIVD